MTTTNVETPDLDHQELEATAKPKVRKKIGRKKQSGRFDSREELVDFVCDKFYNTPLQQAELARLSKVSATTVANIISKGEGALWLVEQNQVTEG